MTIKELMRVARIWGYTLKMDIEDDGKVAVTVAWMDTSPTRRIYGSVDTAMCGILDNLKDYVSRVIKTIEREKWTN